MSLTYVFCIYDWWAWYFFGTRNSEDRGRLFCLHLRSFSSYWVTSSKLNIGDVHNFIILWHIILVVTPRKTAFFWKKRMSSGYEIEEVRLLGGGGRGNHNLDAIYERRKKFKKEYIVGKTFSIKENTKKKKVILRIEVKKKNRNKSSNRTWLLHTFF